MGAERPLNDRSLDRESEMATESHLRGTSVLVVQLHVLANAAQRDAVRRTRSGGPWARTACLADPVAWRYRTSCVGRSRGSCAARVIRLQWDASPCRRLRNPPPHRPRCQLGRHLERADASPSRARRHGRARSWSLPERSVRSLSPTSRISSSFQSSLKSKGIACWSR